MLDLFFSLAIAFAQDRVPIAVASVGTLEITGRLVDENGDPVCRADVDCFFTERDSKGDSSTIVSRGSDREGRFKITVSRANPADGTRRLLQLAVPGDPKTMLDCTQAIVEIPRDISSSTLDLGDVVFTSPGSTKRFARMTDAALEASYRKTVGGEGLLSMWLSDKEAHLCEMARRAGDRWIAFLQGELAHVRAGAKEAAAHPEMACVPWPQDLELLTALRRATGKRDPLAIEIDGDRNFELRFPESLVIRYQLANVDTDSFFKIEGGSYRSGRFARCRFDVLDENDKSVAPLPPPSGMGGGLASGREWKPGEHVDSTISFGEYVQLPHPGRYRVRLQYHNDRDIDSAPEVRGLVSFSSNELIVEGKALRIEMTRKERDEIARLVSELPISESIPLVSGHWHPGMHFVGAATSSQDKLFRMGWKVIPLLLDELERTPVDLDRRAWVLGMLWNSCGIYNPGHCAAIAAREWITSWPTTDEKVERSMTEYGTAFGAIVPQQQEELARKWLALRVWIDERISD